MIPRVFIVAGGLGTRSKNPLQAKIMQEIIGNISLLDFYISFLRSQHLYDLVFLLGKHSDQVIPSLLSYKRQFPDMRIEYVVEESQEGNFPALKRGLLKFPCDEALVILGDILVNFSIKQMLRIWDKSDASVGVVVHPNLHPGDSDRFIIRQNDADFIFLKKHENSSILGLTYSLAGVFLIKTRKLSKIFSSDETIDFTDIGSELIPFLKNDVLPLRSVGYFQDTGTSERMIRARNHVIKGAYNRRGKEALPSIFLDRDGTILRDRPEGRTDFYRDEISKNFINAVKKVNEAGVPIFVITNQPAIAKGFISESQVDSVHCKLQYFLAEAGAFIDDFVYCPHHPEMGFRNERLDLKIICDCRKPKSGLVRHLDDLYGISINESAIVGDSLADSQLANSLRIPFFQVDKVEQSVPDCSKQILIALDTILR